LQCAAAFVLRMRVSLRHALLMLALCAVAGVAAAETRNPKASAGKKSVNTTAAKPLKITPTRPTTARAPKVAAKPAVKPVKVAAKKAAARPKASKASLKAKSPTAARQTRQPRRAMRPVSPARHAVEEISAPSGSETVALTAQQRGMVYRMIVEAPLQPRLVPTERVPAMETARPPSESPPETAAPAPGPSGESIVVGRPLPAEVPLHAIPAGVAAAVPAVERYRYAFVGDRVLLVDPETGVVVAALNQ
jgi:hypothetical protein